MRKLKQRRLGFSRSGQLRTAPGCQEFSCIWGLLKPSLFLSEVDLLETIGRWIDLYIGISASGSRCGHLRKQYATGRVGIHHPLFALDPRPAALR